MMMKVILMKMMMQFTKTPDDEPFVIDNSIKDDGLKDSLCLELKCSKRRATTWQTRQYKDIYIW